MADRSNWQAAQKKRNAELYLNTSAEVRAKEPDTPFYRCVAHYRGEISREELLDVLSTWSYQPQDATDGYDSLLVDVPGSLDDVLRALATGLIDPDEMDGGYREMFPEVRRFMRELYVKMDEVGNVPPPHAPYGSPANPVLPSNRAPEAGGA